MVIEAGQVVAYGNKDDVTKQLMAPKGEAS